MTASDPRVGEIQARLDAATPGPWRWDEKYGDSGDTGLALTNDAGAEIVGAYNTHCCSFRDDPTVEDNDAGFIAAAPADVAYLLAELRDRDEKLAKAWDEGVAFVMMSAEIGKLIAPQPLPCCGCEGRRVTLELFEKHPEADAYRVGGAYQPYAVVAVEKRFSDAELMAEYWQAEVNYAYMRELGGDMAVLASHRASTLLRFATLPHASDTNYE